MTKQFECSMCGKTYPELDENDECDNCQSRTYNEWDDDYLYQSNFSGTVKCAECDTVFDVDGFVWEYRLRHSRKDENGNYLGWNCDRCADLIEAGMGY